MRMKLGYTRSMQDEADLAEEQCIQITLPSQASAPKRCLCPQEDDDDDEDEDDDEEPAAEAIQIDEDIAKKGGVQIDEGLPSSGVQVDAEGVNKRKGPGVEAQKSKR